MSAQSGENVLRVFYQVAASSAGIELSAYELGFTDRVLSVTAQASAAVSAAEEGRARTAIADQIEAEDRAAEEAKRQREGKTGCSCCLS